MATHSVSVRRRLTLQEVLQDLDEELLDDYKYSSGSEYDPSEERDLEDLSLELGVAQVQNDSDTDDEPEHRRNFCESDDNSDHDDRASRDSQNDPDDEMQGQDSPAVIGM